jgi:hypothetical protein
MALPKPVIPQHLADTLHFISARCGLAHTTPAPEKESADYAAHTFNISTHTVKFRAAKITPTKTGQFVTLWKREANGPIQPFDTSDRIDLFIISARSKAHFGIFIFPAGVLLERRILSGNGKEGKRAMRIYPPWDTAVNPQAIKTQQWQLNYFVDPAGHNAVSLANRFFRITSL